MCTNTSPRCDVGLRWAQRHRRSSAPACAATTSATDSARRELDIVFQFDHVDLGLEAGSSHPPLCRRTRPAASPSGRRRRARSAGTAYLDNHDQPRRQPASATNVPLWSATALATALHMLRGTPSTRARSSSMTSRVFHGLDDFRDVEALRYYHGPWSRRPRGVWPSARTVRQHTHPVNGTQ